jgi:hypothetical protein
MRIPAGRLEGLRWFLAEIVIVSVGILIALSVDGIVEARKERKQVREAIGHLENEMRENKRDLDKLLPRMGERRRYLVQALALVEVLIDHRERGVPYGGSFTQGVVTFGLDLPATAFKTAETTGALGHMNYAQVSRYSQTYGVQQEFMRLYARMQDHYAAIAVLSRITLVKLSISELQTWRQNLAVALSHLDAFESMGKTLARGYERGLTTP